MKLIEDIISQIKENHERSITSNQSLSMSEEAPRYKCEKCHDTGWVECTEGVPEGYTAMRECDCVKVRASENRIKNSGLSGEIQAKTFKNFITDYPWQKEMYDKAVEYGKAYFRAKDEGGKLPWFYIAGNPGCGKTHICTAICGVMLKKNIPVTYMQWVTESRRLRAIVNEPDFDAMIDNYISADILYIDDLFKQPGHQQLNVTDAEGRVLFEIINNRYIQNKATIISTEWYLESELMQKDDGTASRIYERAKNFRVSIPRTEEVNQRLITASEEE